MGSCCGSSPFLLGQDASASELRVNSATGVVSVAQADTDALF
jgi:hypothetical protein